MNSNERFSQPDISEIGHNMSEASADQRKAVFERLVAEKDEKWASEALEIDQPFSSEEQALLVSIISDPYLSFEVLTLDGAEKQKLTPEQKEKRMSQIESDEDVAQSFYLQLVESGVAMEPNEIEKWYLERLEKVLKKTDNPEIASYALEYNTSLSKAERKRLERLL